MNFKAILPPLSMALASVFFVGCSADEDPGKTRNESRELWLSVKIAGVDKATRAGETTPDWDARISNVIGYITSTSDNKIIAYGRPFKLPAEGVTDADISYDGSKYEVVLAVSGDLKPNTNYRLYIAANMQASDQQGILNARWGGTSLLTTALTISHPNATWLKWDKATVEANHAMPMGCATPIVINFSDTETYSRENPYHAGGTGSSREMFTLTRCLARVDFKDESPTTTAANTFVIENHSGALAVEFKQCRPVNVNSSSYLVPTFQSGTNPANTVVTIPASQSRYPADVVTLPAATAFTPICYLPENVPTHSSLTIGNATGLSFIGVLKPVAGVCADDLAEYLNGTKLVNGAHPNLYYYDDGRFQSMPMYKTANPGTNWRTLTWNNTLRGYTVSYTETIRHGGYTGQTPAPVKDDGVVSVMEYGVVRNYNYEISISKVKALPHTSSTSDIPETLTEDIDIQITPQANWNYHRGGIEIELEK